ncbi:hypothetical protein THAOC_12276, partial [Thalassiosira oceanica]
MLFRRRLSILCSLLHSPLVCSFQPSCGRSGTSCGRSGGTAAAAARQQLTPKSRIMASPIDDELASWAQEMNFGVVDKRVPAE